MNALLFHIRTIPPTFRRGVGLPLPLHRTFSFPQPLQKDNNPSFRTMSLSFLPSRCTNPLSPQPLQNRTIPQKALSLLPYERSVGFASLRNSGRSTSGIHARPLSKGGGLTARHKLLLCCFLLAICPLFLYCKLFCRQDGGIALHH